MTPPRSHEEACRRVSSRYAERWLRYYTHSKLRSDGVFAAAYELLRDSREPILDLGCGVGLLPFYLRERGLTQPILGLDIDGRKISRAQEIAARAYPDVEFRQQNAAQDFPSMRGSLALLDVLHYLEPKSQAALLRAVAAHVSGRGLVLLRDCPRDGSLRFQATYWCERFAQAISWNLRVPLHFATCSAIASFFREEEFTVEERPMRGQGPFNNRLFIFRRRAPAVVPAAG